MWATKGVKSSYVIFYNILEKKSLQKGVASIKTKTKPFIHKPWRKDIADKTTLYTHHEWRSTAEEYLLKIT